MHQYLFHIDQRFELTRIYKLNELEKYWPEICQNTIKSYVLLQHINQSKHTNYIDYYTDELKNKVAQLCERDIDLNKWTFDG